MTVVDDAVKAGGGAMADVAEVGAASDAEDTAAGVADDAAAGGLAAAADATTEADWDTGVGAGGVEAAALELSVGSTAEGAATGR